MEATMIWIVILSMMLASCSNPDPQPVDPDPQPEPVEQPNLQEEVREYYSPDICVPGQEEFC